MSVAAEQTSIKVALVGNPNTGKSTLFNALCGMRQRVGNFPGVTVEKKVGRTKFQGRELVIIDLPGSYSLAPRSPDEMVAVDVLLGEQQGVERPDVAVCIVDASNLQRNLYLLSQLLELELPVVLALNMVDLAHAKGDEVQVALLRERLPFPVVEIQANRRLGLEQLQSAIVEAAGNAYETPASCFPAAFQTEVAALRGVWRMHGEPPPRYLAERLLLDTSGYLAEADLAGLTPAVMEHVEAARGRLASTDSAVPAVEAISRYRWVGEVTDEVVIRGVRRPGSLTDRIDRVLTSRIWGTLVFVLLMLVIFQSVFSIAEPASWLIDQFNSGLSRVASSYLPAGALRSLVVNGIIEGVGGVLVFLPQIFLLFFFVAMLEDCGYMARAAYLMDKLMFRIGLSGKSFIPLLSSFACAIPGIMAARVIENPKDRLITILVAPLMSCSARLPVYTLLIGAFIPQRRWLGLVSYRGLTLFCMYSVGVLAAIGVALLLRKTIIRGQAPPFVMELPEYKIPAAGTVLHRMYDRGFAFVRRAGTVILAVTILVWAAGYYPRDTSSIDPSLLQSQQRLLAEQAGAPSPELADELAEVENAIAGARLRQSYLGRLGRFVEPVVKPLGWDWRIGCAVIASFPAREVVIATMGVIYNLGDEGSETSLRETLRKAKWEETGTPVFNTPVALSLMVFFALCAQCASTLAVMRRETNSWKWPAFSFAYMTTLAYLGALATYQVGSWMVAG